MNKSPDRVSEVYLGTLSDKSFQRHLRARLHWTCRHVVGRRVLDVGCSQGIVSLLLAREGYEVVGIDIEPSAIEFAQQALAEEPEYVRQKVQFLLGDFFTISLPAESFDSVIVGEVLEHLLQPQRVITRCREVLVEGGKLILTVPFGVHPHADHKITFYLTTLLNIVREGFEPEALELIHTSAGAGTPVPIMSLVVRKTDDVSTLDAARIRTWLAFSERAFAAAEERYLALLDNLEQQRTTLREQVAKLQGLQAEAAAKEREQQQAKAFKEQLAAVQQQLAQRSQEQTELGRRLTLLAQEKIELEQQLAQRVQAQEPLEQELEQVKLLLQHAIEDAQRTTETDQHEIARLQYALALDEQEVGDLLTERKLIREHLRLWQLLEQRLRASIKDREQVVTQLRRRLAMMEDATSYKLGLLLVRCAQRPYRFLLLPYRVLQLITSALKRKARKKQGKLAPRLASLPRELKPVPNAPVKRTVDFIASVRPRDGQTATSVPMVLPSTPTTVSGLQVMDLTFPLPPPTLPLPEPPEIEIPEGPIRRTDIHVAAIFDEFSWPCFQYEANMMRITPGNWRRLFEAQRPDFLFVESAWRGNDNQWRYLITNGLSKERGPQDLFIELIRWCQKHEIPTVFWNKEDPPNFDIFIQAAALFDYVLTTDANCIPRYVEALKHERVHALPFAAQTALHNPRPVLGGRPYPLAFAGTWYARKHPERQAQADAVLRPGLDFGLHIFDRMQNYGLAQRDYLWPDEYLPHIVGSLSYWQMISAYRQYRAFLNVNSVTNSPTMLSRRVFELLACGTPVISGESRAIRELLGDEIVLLSEQEHQTHQHLERLLREESYRQDLTERGCLRVLTEHTYSHRFEEIVKLLDLPQGTKPVVLPMPEAQLRSLAREGQADRPDARTISHSLLLPPMRPAPKELDYEERFNTYLERVAASPSEYFILMFSGTTFIQERRGNRPIKMANVLLEQEIPIFFSYYRWHDTESIAEDHHPLLFQSPIDLTQKYMDRIMEYPFPGKKKLFVSAFPHVLCARSIDALHAHGWVTLYDAQDDWEEFHRVGHAQWYREELEHHLCSRSDVVCAVAQPLCDKLQRYREEKPVLLLPNALDTSFLMPFNAGRIAPRGGKPIFGYFGHLSKGWFDWESLSEIARRKPGWSFEIIGHFEPEGLTLPENIRLLGSRTHLEINEIARRWRVGIIPFRIGPLSNGVDPIKIYEYLALGLPTVSFTMPQMAHYPYVHLAANIDEFVAQAETSLTESLDREKIDAWLAYNRWEDRVATILQWTEEVLANPGPLKGIALAEAYV